MTTTERLWGSGAEGICVDNFEESEAKESEEYTVITQTPNLHQFSAPGMRLRFINEMTV
jgi:hypothetical protein